MRDKVLVLIVCLKLLLLIGLIGGLHELNELKQMLTYYPSSYILSDSKRQEVIDAKGMLVQVDVFKYGDDVQPFYKVVHCRAVDTAIDEEVVECYIDEVRR